MGRRGLNKCLSSGHKGGQAHLGPCVPHTNPVLGQALPTQATRTQGLWLSLSSQAADIPGGKNDGHTGSGRSEGAGTWGGAGAATVCLFGVPCQARTRVTSVTFASLGLVKPPCLPPGLGHQSGSP